VTGRRPLAGPERITFAISVAILLALVGSIAWLGIQPRTEATITVEVSGDRRTVGPQTYVTVRVANAGDETAEAVQVMAKVTDPAGEVVAEGEQTVDFLSGHEDEDLVFVFEGAAPETEIELRVASYLVP